MDSANLVNASIVTYVSFTFLFFVLKFRFFPKTSYYWILVFLMLSCILQLIQNVSLTSSSELCGAPDVSLAVYSTVVPWVIIFTVFTLFLLVAPGWLRIFSNTFGVAAAEAYGIKDTLNVLFNKPLQPSTDPKVIQMLDTIYSDRMALVIELDIDDVTEEPFNFPAFNKLIEMNIIDKFSEEKTEYLKKLYSALLIKENVGFFFWFLLIGIFCILVSTITLISSTCTPKMGTSYSTIFS